MDAPTLKKHLTSAMLHYAGFGENSVSLPLFDDKRQHYMVTKIDYPSRKEIAELLLLARIVDDKVIIEDTVDKTLADALLERGVPREQLILVYNDEPAPPPPIEGGRIDEESYSP